MKKIGIMMGSDSDLPVVKKAIDTLASFGVPYEVHIYSAHRTPEQAKDFAWQCQGQRLWCHYLRGGHGGPSGRSHCRKHPPAGHRHSNEIWRIRRC